MAHIPDCQPEHAIEAVEYLIAPLLVSVDDDFCVRVRSENVAVPLQFTLELMEVIDFTVENHPNGFFPIRHGLMAARKVNDREPAKTESDWSGDVEPFVIRTSVGDGLGHRFDVPALNGRLVSEVILSANAAHKMALVSSLRLR